MNGEAEVVDEARATDNRAALLCLALIESINDNLHGRLDDAIERLDRQREMLPRVSMTWGIRASFKTLTR